MWNRWRGKLAGEGLLRRANQTVTDGAAGRTDHREASGGVAAASRDVCSGVPVGRTDGEKTLPRLLCAAAWPWAGAEQGGQAGLPAPPARCAMPLATSKICVFALGPVAR